MIISLRAQLYLYIFMLPIVVLWSTLAYGNSCRFFLKENIKELHEKALESVVFSEEGVFFIFERKLRIAIYEAFEGKDFYTGKPIPFNEMSVDHIIPRALGGPNNIANYVLTNSASNAAKGNSFTRTDLDNLLMIQNVYVPRVFANLKLYGAFENRPKDLELAIEASTKKESYRYYQSSNEKISIDHLLKDPTLIFRKRMDITSPAVQEILYFFSRKLVSLNEVDFALLVNSKLFEFELNSRSVVENFTSRDKQAYSIFLSYRSKGSKLETETQLLETQLFEIIGYHPNPRGGNITITLGFHPLLAQKLRDAPASNSLGIEFINNLLKPLDIQREEFVSWTEY